MTDKVGSHLMLLAVCGTLAGGVPIAAQGAPLLDVVQVAAGGQHTCAVTTGGRVLCWGNNNFGQLGNPAPGEQVFAVSVTDLEGVKTVVTGEHHTCALTTVGGVKCWGSGILLGDGSTTNRSTPTDVIGLSSGVVALSAGGWHTCAAMQNGRVMCWGLNQYGQIGDGTTTTRSTPVNVGGLGSGPWHRVAVGLYHTCAHTSTTPGGIAKCWGWNRDGQLGDGTTTDRLSPVDVLTVGSKVASIAAGPLHTCANTPYWGGVEVWCWGANGSGELGTGTTTTSGGKPQSALEAYGSYGTFWTVVAGIGYTCGVSASNGLKCWGRNDSGQLGDGTKTDRLTPVDVKGLGSDVKAIAAGYGHACAVTNSGGVKCWGRNSSGQLGDLTMVDRPTPVDVQAGCAP